LALPNSAAAPRTLSPAPFPRTSYRAAFQRCLQIDPLRAQAAELQQIAIKHKIAPPGIPADDRDGWLNLLLAELVEPKLGGKSPEFLYDYPASQAALAKIRNGAGGEPAVAERFELYIRGIEICNGYNELTDAEELLRRNQRQNEIRAAEGRVTLPIDSRLIAAMRQGLPACSGVALGFDRLAMVVAGVDSLAEVMPFPLAEA
jgi:elongation factor P--(R)-beta-lysine ligase